MSAETHMVHLGTTDDGIWVLGPTITAADCWTRTPTGRLRLVGPNVRNDGTFSPLRLQQEWSDSQKGYVWEDVPVVSAVEAK